MTILPVMARVYGLSPADVFDLTHDQLSAFIEDLEAMRGAQ